MITSGLLGQTRIHELLADMSTDIKVIVPFSSNYCGAFDVKGGHEAQIMQEYVGYAITDSTLFETAILLNACRSILRVRPHDSQLRKVALQYRANGLHKLRKSIEHPRKPVNALVVTRALALSIDEVSYSHIDYLAPLS